MVYAANVDGKRFTFQPSGSLWQDALVMHDPETGSMWAQILGEAIQGEMEGKKLELFPSQMMSYAAFKSTYPHGKLLKKPAGEAGAMAYESYFSDPERLGIFGRVNDFKRLPGKAYVFGVRDAKKQVAVAKEYLETNKFVLLEQFDPPLLMVYDKTRESIVAYDAGSFSAYKVNKGMIHATQGDTLSMKWDAATGRALDSSCDDLKTAPVITSYWFAWTSFFPETELIK